jgi:hypothetical protein
MGDKRKMKKWRLEEESRVFQEQWRETWCFVNINFLLIHATQIILFISYFLQGTWIEGLEISYKCTI